MRKLVLAALAAAALAVPASPASAECTNVVSVLGANGVQLCSYRRWEYMHYTYGCTLDTNFDGQPEAACQPLFEVVIPG